MKPILLLASALIFANPSSASIYATEQMDEFCKSKLSQQACTGFLAGVWDTIDALKSWNELKSKGYCPPVAITTYDLKAIFVEYAGQHPELHYATASSVALSAFIQAFPCE